MRSGEWCGPDGDLAGFVSEESRKTLNSYREQPKLIDEHANLEQNTARGGYQHRQLFELIQNSADALWFEPRVEIPAAMGRDSDRGRIVALRTHNESALIMEVRSRRVRV